MRLRPLKIRAFFSLLLFVGIARSDPSFAVENGRYRVIDATGTETQFEHTPKRIVPLEPSLAELVDRIGTSPEEVVGVTAYTDFPFNFRSKPSVGSYTKPNLETILSLKPDLVLASRDGTPKETVTRLRKLGVPVVTVATETLAGLRDSYSIVGAAIGKTAEASKALGAFDHALAEIRTRATSRASPTVLLQIGEDPLVVAAGKTFLNEGLILLGARNVYADATQTYPRVSVEDVLKKNPEVIILVVMGKDITPFSSAEKRWKSFSKLAANRANRIVLLHSDSLLRPGPRFPAGLLELERAIYASPEARK